MATKQTAAARTVALAEMKAGVETSPPTWVAVIAIGERKVLATTVAVAWVLETQVGDS